MEHLKRSDNIAFTAPTGIIDGNASVEVMTNVYLAYFYCSVCCLAGVAACNIRGLTVHAWASIGLAKEPIEQLVAKVQLKIADAPDIIIIL